MKPATKKQLWALYCLTKKDYRNSNLTIEEASKLISELTKGQNQDKEKLSQVLSEAIKKAYAEYEKAYELEPDAIIYEADLNGNPIPKGKKYYEQKFSGCGSAYLLVFGNTLKAFKKAMKKQDTGYYLKLGNHQITMSKNYGGGYLVIVDRKSYDNGNINCLVSFYETIAKHLKDNGYEDVYANYRLD